MASNHPHTATSILDKFYAAEREFAAGKTDGSEMLQSLSEDFKGYQSEDLPYGGVYEGKKMFMTMGGLFSQVDAKPDKILVQEDMVVFVGNVHFTVRKTQEQSSLAMTQVIKVDLEKGLITEMRPFYWNVGGFNALLKAAGAI
ncbi:MAG: hypothetical protein CYPHOPRED_004063 [Cyphobasidiales sp. Tagirdzhanova-0007]|nr:MAG: hypothetical protein CYPHOPRED_004063 [Cyphobasidiales sp. Tagirdzhanova-0007]